MTRQFGGEELCDELERCVWVVSLSRTLYHPPFNPSPPSLRLQCQGSPSCWLEGWCRTSRRGGQGDMTWNSQVVEQDLSCRTERGCARCHRQQQHLRARMNLHVHQSSDAEIKKKKKKRPQHLSRLLMNLSKQEKLIIGNHQISSDKWLMTLVLLQRVIVLLNFEKSTITWPSGCLMEMFSARQPWWKGHKGGLKCKKRPARVCS